MAFNIALSGLNAASKDLEVTANNIANTGTTGFKGSRAQIGRASCRERVYTHVVRVD